MSNPLFNIQYGLFVITTCDEGRDNGCISNTVAQVTAQPNRISVALNKGNFTTELIQRSGKFTASIISEAADAVIIEPNFPREGITCEFRNRLSASIHSISSKHIFIITDDFDKYMETDESSGKSTQELIYMFDYLRGECPGGVDENGNIRKTFTLIATMNNPKQLANAVIKRSERFDEVIEIGLPQPYVYGKRLMFLKDADDATDFESFKYRIVYWYMRHKVITLADIGNIYSILKTHRGKPCRNCTYGVRDLLYAVKMIIKNRSTANKDYVL